MIWIRCALCTRKIIRCTWAAGRYTCQDCTRNPPPPLAAGWFSWLGAVLLALALAGCQPARTPTPCPDVDLIEAECTDALLACPDQGCRDETLAKCQERIDSWLDCS